MVSSKRLIRAAGTFAKSSATPYVCASCRGRAVLTSPSQQQICHNSDLPFTEKLRRKIWGTDNPPGLKDPYGGPSFLERRLAQRRQGKQPQSEDSETQLEPQSQLRQVDEEPQTSYKSKYAPNIIDRADPKQYKMSVADADYKEAETWDGLEWVGHKGEYQFMEPKEQDEYQPFLTPTTGVMLTEEELWDAMHESVFDAVQPADEAYDREMALLVTPEGYVARTEEGAGGDPKAFMTAKLNFKDSQGPTFKILKNFQKLTNVRLSDPTLNKLSQNPAATLNDLVQILLEAQKPKPKGTHDSLIANEELMAQRNVKISGRKIGPVDREREIGRWKVIEKALEERGLPVLGRADGMQNPWVKDQRNAQQGP